MISDSVDISIIVPIYNAEEFLKETIESILFQSFSNFELLLINDGSTDQSQFICEEFAKIDSRVKLINKINGGVSSARNFGVKNAIGTHIYHVDADDILRPNALMYMHKEAIRTGADIIVANYIVRYGNKKKQVIKQKASQTAEEFLQGMLWGDYHAGLWNKLIHKDCYHHLSFDEKINCMEDKLILTQMLLKKPSILFLDFEVYTYIQRSTSITNNKCAKTLLSMGKVIEQIDNLLRSKKIFEACLIRMKLVHKITLLKQSHNLENGQLINKFQEVNANVLRSDMIPLFYRIMLWLEFHHISFITKIFRAIR